MNMTNPCMTCGACCAHYRVSFYWAEADESVGGAVPAPLTEKLNDFFSAMKGTNQKNPRCLALQGAVGSCVRCAIYEKRPSACRELSYSWENGVHNERCERARIAWGLPPLQRPDCLRLEN
jgi:Fe-S-cluster containining protein